MQFAVIVSVRSLDFSSFHIIVAAYNRLVVLENSVTIFAWKKLPPMVENKYHAKYIKFGFDNSPLFHSIKPLIQLKDDMKRSK